MLLIGSSIIYSLSSGIYTPIYGVRIITQGVRIRTWVPNTDTPVGNISLNVSHK